jgi:hypothetical protein
MSDQQPPAGVPEYLDSGSGPLLPPASAGPETPRRGRRRTTWLVGGGLVGALALGAGAWAAISFFSQGAQPAEALPSTTVAYAAIDLDPSGSQKIDAFRTLDKFPAFKDKVGIHSVDDVRRKLGDELIKGLGCDLTFSADIDPWLGDRAAVASVDLGHAEPDEVSVVQVTDDGKAEAGLHRLLTCGDSPPTDVAFDVHDGWAVLGKSQDVVDQVVSETDHASLADDATYQRWTKAVGDSGVVNLYAAPAAGDYLARQLSGLESGLGGLSFGSGQGTAFSDASGSVSGTAYHATSAADDGGALGQALKDFTGAAATIRFTGNGLELATVSDPALSQAGLASDQGGAVVQRLPDDTAAAVGVGLEPGWLKAIADRVAHYSGDGDGQHLLDDLATQTGLTLPGDLETLVGSSTALSVSKDFDYEAAAMSNDGTGVPVAVTVQGDPAAIEKVLDKLRGRAGGSTAALGSDSSGDLVAIGPTAAYRRELLAGGHLGDSAAFRSVVPDAGHASLVVYVDLDDLEKPLSQVVGDSGEVSANLAPLQAFGFSAWMDGDVARTSLKVSTH